MMEKLLQYDQELFLFLNNLGSENWDWFWVFLSHKFAAVPLYILLLYLIFRNFGWKGTLITVVLVAGLITCTDQLANVFKDGFERLRPCREDFIQYARYLDDYCGKYGFFSAHAASTMAAAFYVGFILKPFYKIVFPLLFLWAALVGFSRIYIGVHYPGDVLVGMIIGALLGFGFYKLQVWMVKKFA
ncbi:MAG TPA: phosphatase PAP2 family protein [Flavobacteriaceae bacterium]|nr:phosphatase PAP2 family protein [Flavobacteriaceae bacterium]